MDIYQESISFLGNDANFDANGLFQCELSSNTNDHDEALFLTIFKNETTINLHMSLTSPVELPTPLPESIAIAIGEHALEPFRGGFGVGLMPDSRRLTVYKVISLANKPQSYVQNTFQQLLEKIEQWHLFIEQTDNEEAIPEQLPAGIFI
ncbi:TPA: Ati1 family type III secretion system chaperone [Vibrio parahaemolyticus]|nr:Ati1 family type III secretion system chaperone [Vibrio parahaemolyticus]HCK0611042.1 Ati1 family type III secretion system chaperone [Vibrio parahaemolyticus]HCK0613982.1 Ati1 family type III secretion system chaperone [Vibrio parahaemolyticus]